MRVFLDTNILAYLFDDAEPERQERARLVIAMPDVDRRISTQVLIELHSVLTRRLACTREDAAEILRTLDLPTVTTDRTLVLRAADTAAAHQLSILDAMILEAAVHAGCDELWTEDLPTGATLRGVRIADPLARGSAEEQESVPPGE